MCEEIVDLQTNQGDRSHPHPSRQPRPTGGMGLDELHHVVALALRAPLHHRLAGRVRDVGVGPGGQQGLDRILLAKGGGQGQRRAPGVSLHVDVGPGIQ